MKRHNRLCVLLSIVLPVISTAAASAEIDYLYASHIVYANDGIDNETFQTFIDPLPISTPLDQIAEIGETFGSAQYDFGTSASEAALHINAQQRVTCGYGLCGDSFVGGVFVLGSDIDLLVSVSGTFTASIEYTEARAQVEFYEQESDSVILEVAAYPGNQGPATWTLLGASRIPAGTYHIGYTFVILGSRGASGSVSTADTDVTIQIVQVPEPSHAGAIAMLFVLAARRARRSNA